MFITYPDSIKSSEFCFKVNDDDMSTKQAKACIEFLRKNKKLEVKKEKRYSNVKLMAWHVFKIKAGRKISSFEENMSFCSSVFQDFLAENNYSLKSANQ